MKMIPCQEKITDNGNSETVPSRERTRKSLERTERSYAKMIYTGSKGPPNLSFHI